MSEFMNRGIVHIMYMYTVFLLLIFSVQIVHFS